MKRFVLLGVAATLAFGAGTTPASADIHLASQCGTPARAGAAVISLRGPSNLSLIYGGVIYGSGMTGTNGDHLTITSLTLTNLGTGSQDSLGPATVTTPAPDPANTLVSLSKTITGAPGGVYELVMNTDVKCSAGNPAGWSGTPERSGRYLFVPGGNPIKLA